ncbi:MAG: hypothetical protein FWC83_01150, partial [Alphaproteobacteria bacterium]|nr:hypothetical protein [Alphaproteobacteria bacterium]
ANFVPTAQVGVAGGVASLGADGRVPASQLPSGMGNVQADWNATTGGAQILNRPTLGTAAAANIGVASGVAGLDTNSRVPVAQMPTTVVQTTGTFTITGTLNVPTQALP